MLIKCEPESTVLWLLEHCTERMEVRGLNSPFVEARQEDGLIIGGNERLSRVFDDHPV